MFWRLTNAEQFTMEGRKAAVQETNLRGQNLAKKRAWEIRLKMIWGDIPQKEGGGLVSDKALIDSCSSNNNWIGYHY